MHGTDRGRVEQVLADAGVQGGWHRNGTESATVTGNASGSKGGRVGWGGADMHRVPLHQLRLVREGSAASMAALGEGAAGRHPKGKGRPRTSRGAVGVGLAQWAVAKAAHPLGWVARRGRPSTATVGIAAQKIVS